MNVNIKLNENVSLRVKITPQLWEDYQECGRMAMLEGGSGKNCRSCSLDTGIFVGLCQIDGFTDFLGKLVQRKGSQDLYEADAKSGNYGG